MTNPASSLCDELKVMLAEAGSRAAPDDAVRVIAGTLGALAEEHPGLLSIANDWRMLVPSTAPSDSDKRRHLEAAG